MAVRPSTSVMDTQQGGMQVGDNNNIYYSNCHITNITHITYNCKQCHPTDEHDVTQDASRDLRSTSTVQTTTIVRLLDRKGRELELGDVLYFNNKALMSIYAGDGMIIMRDKETGKIVLEPINVEEPFTSLPFPEQKYIGRQVAQRAKGKVGQVYDSHNVDFVYWCCCDMTFKEWKIHNGLQDTAPFARYLQLHKALSLIETEKHSYCSPVTCSNCSPTDH